MIGQVHIVLGSLSWRSLSAADQEAWHLSLEVPDHAPGFIKAPAFKTVADKIGHYSTFLDSMGWRSEPWFQTPEYLLDGKIPVPHGLADQDLYGCMTSERWADPESSRIVLRQYIEQMTAEIRRGNMEQAALYGGVLAHYIQDASALGHMMPNSLFYDVSPEDGESHVQYHILMDSCNPPLEKAIPKLLGSSVPETVFRLGEMIEQNLVMAERILFPMLEACRANDAERMNTLAKPLMQRAVFQAASLFHTALALEQNKADPEEAAELGSFDLTEAIGHTVQPGGAYRHIIRGHSVVDGKLKPLRLDLGRGPETIDKGLGMTSFVSVRYLLEPGAFTYLEGRVGLSSDFKNDQEPDMEVEFFIGLDKDYNRTTSGELDYGKGMKKAYSVRLKPGVVHRFCVELGNARTLLLGALTGVPPVVVNGKEKYWFPHIVVAYPKLTKAKER